MVASDTETGTTEEPMPTVALHLIPNVSYAARLGSTAAPVITHVAACVAMGPWSLPPVTLTGVACGECSYEHRRDGHRGQVRHADVTAVRDCGAIQAENEAESLAEAALYRRECDYWDNGGPYREAIARDLELDRLHGM
jgi:hypothetical protein